jgi:hypothetical protein
MWDPQRLTTLWACMACYRDSCVVVTIYPASSNGNIKKQSRIVYTYCTSECARESEPVTSEPWHTYIQLSDLSSCVASIRYCTNFTHIWKVTLFLCAHYLPPDIDWSLYWPVCIKYCRANVILARTMKTEVAGSPEVPVISLRNYKVSHLGQPHLILTFPLREFQISHRFNITWRSNVPRTYSIFRKTDHKNISLLSIYTHAIN